MKRFLVLALVASVIFSIVPYSSAQTEDTSLIGATSEIVKIGITLTKSSVQSGDFRSAEQYSKFTTDFYSQQIMTLRESNAQSVDDLHLLLIDIHSKIASGKTDSIITDLDLAIQYLDKFPRSDQTPFIIYNMLSVADHAYQVAKSDDNFTQYVISTTIVERASTLFDSDNSFDARQKGEIQSFFAELKSNINDKKEFVIVGKLVTTIQRDIAGTDVLVMDSGNL
ncbi:MAG: hypothetical protein JRZ94_01740, partial [Nitrososphaerota archaeon]|nr:hypothetical protein [Nitrososphaerota archaeon]